MKDIKELVIQFGEIMATIASHPDCPSPLRSAISNFCVDVQDHGNGLTQLASTIRGPMTSALMDMLEDDVEPTGPMVIEPTVMHQDGDQVATAITLEEHCGQRRLGVALETEVVDLTAV